ncbi:MAG: hypothetical protein ACRDC6_16230 [Shewanella sp.]
MRDLGLMGERIFTYWCAESGLIANGSQVDRTGWDYLVEFPFQSSLSAIEIHKPAFECKVQVKATDKQDKKLPITLSNLRRLVTAQIPAFIVFIEFDGKEDVQRAYVVHVDKELISKVLKRIHEVEQSDSENNLNKRTITIHYDESNLLDIPNGTKLKECLIKHIGHDLSKYISYKRSHLESTGFENGSMQITFTADGEQNLRTLIDVSLGIQDTVEVSKFIGTSTRFGISSNKSIFNANTAKLAMPDIKPTAMGRIRFKEDRLSAGLTFDCKLYISPLSHILPEDLKKFRLAGDFFDLTCIPHTGSVSYTFTFSEGTRLEIREYRNALKLVEMLSKPNKSAIAELIFDNYPKLSFSIFCDGDDIDFSDELNVFDCAIKLISYFEFNDYIDVSFDDVYRYQKQIRQMHSIISADPNLFRIDFGLDDEDYVPCKDTACLALHTTIIGSHVFGIIFAIIGDAEEIERHKYKLLVKDVVVAKKIVSEKESQISDKDLHAAINSIEDEFGKNYTVITMLDR